MIGRNYLSRRDFLHQLALNGIAVAGLSNIANGALTAISKQKAVRILCVADIHFYGNSKPHYPKTVSALPVFWDMLKKRSNYYDMMVVAGDCVNAGSANIEELTSLKQKLDSIGIEYHLVAGNHDIAPSEKYAQWYPGMEDMEDCRLEETNFARVFGVKSIRDVIDVGSVQLVLFSIRDHDKDCQLDWLKSVLSSGKRSIVFCHYPVYSSRKEGFCHDWGYSRISHVRQKIIDILTAEKSNVGAYFCGHQHINSRVEVDGLQQVVMGSLGLQTCSCKEMEISEAGIKVKTFKLPGISDWLGDAMQKDRSQDEEHKTVTSYHWGNDAERDFRIDL